MPTKILTSPSAGRGNPHTFGGGSNDIIAQDHDDGIGYVIDVGGGNDTITGADFANLAMTTGSDDTLIGGDGSDTVSGGLGGDTIYGGNEDGSDGGKGNNPVVTNTLIGEEKFIFLNGATYTGGDDTLVAGNDVTNFMFGDVQSVSGPGSFIGGDDTLISGTGNDTMVGDWSSSGGDPALTGGDDTFVFAPNNGNDTIMDFEVAVFDSTTGELIDANDLIDLTAFGAGLTFADLNWVDLDTIEFSAGNTLSFGGGLVEADFSEEDFIFEIA
jgi:Ca2+-binding RTX toxin-like protein